MQIYIALLRAINVSGQNLIKMAELKQMFEGMGFGRVQTYIQSGNVLFESGEDPSALRPRIEAEIQRVFGLTVTVLLRTPAELAEAIDRCPFPESEGLYVAFLSEEPSSEGIAKLMEATNEAEQCQVVGRQAYLLYRDGAGRAKLTNAVLERRLGVQSTARNWRTTTKLLALGLS